VAAQPHPIVPAVISTDSPHDASRLRAMRSPGRASEPDAVADAAVRHIREEPTISATPAWAAPRPGPRRAHPSDPRGSAAVRTV